MADGSGVSRGDGDRNARLGRLRVLVAVSNAIVGIDLAGSKQMVVVTDHDSKVLARRTFRCRAWDLGCALDWAAERARAKGFAGVTVSCEPTGHRWRVLGQLAADRLMPFVCVQPMITSWSRRVEDLTQDKTDENDAGERSGCAWGFRKHACPGPSAHQTRLHHHCHRYLTARTMKASVKRAASRRADKTSHAGKSSGRFSHMLRSGGEEPESSRSRG